jgi:predicted choloylglycine hydrolase
MADGGALVIQTCCSEHNGDVRTVFAEALTFDGDAEDLRARTIKQNVSAIQMFHPTVRGKYHEMGYSYGTVLYKHGFRISQQSDDKLEFGRRSEKEVRRVFPEVLEEIKGFADACHGSYEQLAGLIFSVGAFKPEPSCSVFAASDGSEVVFGRNYDFYYSFKKYTESYLTCPENGYRSLGHSDIFIGREDGINENGLAIGMTGVESEGNRPGISFCLALRCVLDKCANVEEGIKTLSNAHLSSTHNFLLADRDADMAVVEVSPEKTSVRRPEEGESFILCTNHFLSPQMQDMEDQKARSGSNWDSLPRYAAIYDSLKKRKGKVNVTAAQRILSDHSGFVCSHQEKIKLGTIWSVAASLRNLQIYRAEGHPCRTRYRQDSRLNKALQKWQGQV